MNIIFAALAYVDANRTYVRRQKFSSHSFYRHDLCAWAIHDDMLGVRNSALTLFTDMTYVPGQFMMI